MSGGGKMPVGMAVQVSSQTRGETQILILITCPQCGHQYGSVITLRPHPTEAGTAIVEAGKGGEIVELLRDGLAFPIPLVDLQLGARGRE
jgi:hypothetical protein